MGFSIMMGVLSFCTCLVAYLCYSLLYVGYAYQYGHAVAKIDHVNGDYQEI